MKNHIIKTFFPGLLSVLMAGSFCSCSQSVPPQKVASTTKAFANDTPPKNLSKYSQATFAAGCFWHEQTLFESIKGVTKVTAGYAGGNKPDPTYEDVETGTTGHAETVNIYYDSSQISFPTLVKVFFDAQEDPTQVNGQGPDQGTQYRSIAFYRNGDEERTVKNYIATLNASGNYHKDIAAQVMPYTKFWNAEGYHQDYINTNSDNPYVQSVSIPDIMHYQQKHPEMIKPGHSFASK